MSLVVKDGVEHFKCNDLQRWKVAIGGLCSIRLHRWRKGDPEHLQHKHPWRFVTIVLTGGYDDVAAGRAPDHVRAPAVRYRPLDWRHAVVNVQPGTWSIVITGRVIDDWRFWIGDREVNEADWNDRTC